MDFVLNLRTYCKKTCSDPKVSKTKKNINTCRKMI